MAGWLVARVLVETAVGAATPSRSTLIASIVWCAVAVVLALVLTAGVAAAATRGEARRLQGRDERSVPWVLVLVVLALISALSAERVRTMPRPLWVLTIPVVPLLGPIAYLAMGRPRNPRRRGATTAASGRPAAPDDDPDFLRTLNAEQARRDRELLAELERQLRAAEDDDARRKADETRRRDNEDTPPTGV